MIVYNTTFHVEKGIQHESLDYLRAEFIPKAIESGILNKPCLRKILHESEDEGVNFSVQFHVEDIETLNNWLQKEGQFLHKDLIDRFGSQIAGFSTLLEEIELEA